MTSPILATKLTMPPPRPRIVPRPRLLDRLLEGVEQSAGFSRKLTLISAPAGFGKTTLLVDWIQALQGAEPPFAAGWLSLDEGDNDPIRFLRYVAAGLTNQEIDDRLYLSLHTVKAHTRNIYAKLDVKSRTQAVARANTAGMLPTE